MAGQNNDEAAQNHLPLEIKRRHFLKGIGFIGAGGGAILADHILNPIRYVMSLPIATLVSGIDSLSVLRQNLAIARGFQPMQAKEMQALRDRCAQYAADGRFELFKTSKQFDADEGRIQHGFPPQSQVQT